MKTLEQIEEEWKQNQFMSNGENPYQFAFRLYQEAYQSGRDAQRESDAKLCTHTYKHLMDLWVKIKNNTGEL
jgi:collagenase-like PrtC family protease